MREAQLFPLGCRWFVKNVSSELGKYLKNQGNCKSINLEFQDQIEKELSNIEKHIEYVEMTDCFITCLEVNKVLKTIKVGKSSGPDKIINEILKYSKPGIFKSYTKLFNLILKSGCYPKSWKQSYIIAIHKSGDKSNLNNYRGISLMNCLSKIFSVIINARLTNFIDNK